MGPELLKHRFGLRTFLRLMERNPKGTLAYVQVLREVGGGRYFEGLLEGGSGPGVLKRMFHAGALLEGGAYGTSWLSAWLGCARLFESGHLNQLLVETLSEELDHRDDMKDRLALLPISSLGDLRWLAEQTADLELRSLVEELSS